VIMMHFSVVWSAFEVVSGLACQWAEWRRRLLPDHSVAGGVADDGATVTVRVAVSGTGAGVVATTEVVVTIRLTPSPRGCEQLEAGR